MGTGGGGSTRIPHPFFFTVFNMGDLPKINGKIRKKFPNRGEGGGPLLGKNSRLFPFFFGNVPKASQVILTSKKIINSYSFYD